MKAKIIFLVIVMGICDSVNGLRSSIKRLDDPYVTLYSNEFHRGEQHVEFLKGGCKNLPETRDNWASSINTHNRCVDVCDMKDCQGRCIRMYPSSSTKNNFALKLSLAELNDQISSLKSCYTLLKG
ncbi:unnamed protein product [Allacma fusca]|uniref:Uncharacterized protein n=1 Tax=Allacma fusca TaxID=39272 RepID=A0A8J2LHK5_9HEXA|nr:unnamed protein product [Allacma fusca]